MAVTTLKLDLTPWRVDCIGRALAGCQVAEVRDAAADLHACYGQDLSRPVIPDSAGSLAVTAKLSWPRTVIAAFTAELGAALPQLAENHCDAVITEINAVITEINAVITEIGIAVGATDEVIAEHHRTGTPYIRDDGIWEPAASPEPRRGRQPGPVQRSARGPRR